LTVPYSAAGATVTAAKAPVDGRNRGTPIGRQRVVLTSDNPRSEEPLARFLREISVAGATAEQHCRSRTEPRPFAERLLQAASPADVVLLAGKGHEPYQEIAGVRRPFSDIDAGEGGACCAPWRTSNECQHGSC
jgi:hypothetical protein